MPQPSGKPPVFLPHPNQPEVGNKHLSPKSSHIIPLMMTMYYKTAISCRPLPLGAATGPHSQEYVEW